MERDTDSKQIMNESMMEDLFQSSWRIKMELTSDQWSFSSLEDWLFLNEDLKVEIVEELIEDVISLLKMSETEEYALNKFSFLLLIVSEKEPSKGNLLE